MLSDTLLSLGFDHTAELPADKVPFNKNVRLYCNPNDCQGYGKNYTCPPYVGEPEDLIARAKQYQHVLVFQKVYAVEDSFDMEGYAAAGVDFRKRSQKAGAAAKKEYPGCLILSAGGCQNCSPCAVTENKPCRFPEEAYSSLEGYCIQVSALARAAKLKYMNGTATVTYFGAVFFNDPV